MQRDSLKVLAVEPYYGGSHRAFLDAVAKASRHEWMLITGAARHWKWRMRNAPLALANKLVQQLAESALGAGGGPHVIFCSDMLDLPQWRGFLCSAACDRQGLDRGVAEPLVRIATLPAITYFHENQWTYPQSPQARDDAHYGYTNLLTALASEETWFNSHFHRNSFMQAAREFVSRMPDHLDTHELDRLEARCQVVPPGFEPVGTKAETCDAARQTRSNATEGEHPKLRIGWASRWEHDKRPDRFEKLLEILSERSQPFELVLLGARSRMAPPSLAAIESRYADRIHFSGYARDRAEYCRRLREMDVIVSTADHEFFGIAVCEAISAGAIPVLPDALSYPELAEPCFCYRSLEEAADIIQRCAPLSNRQQIARQCFERIQPFRIERTAQLIDDGIDRVVGVRREDESS